MNVTMPRSTVVAAVIAALISGCGVANSVTSGESDPTTPQQSESHVSDAATEIVEALDLDVVEAVTSNSACSVTGEDGPSQGNVKFQRKVRIDYQQSPAEVAKMAERLKTLGWSPDLYFFAHGTVLEKNNVIVSFHPQSVDNQISSIYLYGQCQDSKTTKEESVNQG